MIVHTNSNKHSLTKASAIVQLISAISKHRDLRDDQELIAINFICILYSLT